MTLDQNTGSGYLYDFPAVDIRMNAHDPLPAGGAFLKDRPGIVFRADDRSDQLIASGQRSLSAFRSFCRFIAGRPFFPIRGRSFKPFSEGLKIFRSVMGVEPS